MYRIGVDARLLCERITGIGRYTFENLSRLTPLDHQWVLYANRPIIMGSWQQDNVRIVIDPFSSGISRHIWAQSVLPFRANRDELDLFWSPTHRLPNFLSPKIARVVTIHDLVWKHVGETMRTSGRLAEKLLMPQAVRIADRIMTDSKATERDLLGTFPETRGKIRTVYLGKPEPSSSPCPSEKFDVPESYILFVGTMEPRKNLERLIIAYSRIPRQLRDVVKLVIAGGKGWGDVNAHSLVQRLEIDANVHILGYIDKDQLTHLYSNALFLAMPSLYEGFGLPLLEAMAAGTPVLTSNLSSMPEVAGHGGLLVDPFNTEDIVKGLLNLLKNSRLRQDLSQKALLQADRFSWEKTARETFEVFEEAITLRSKKRGGFAQS